MNCIPLEDFDRVSRLPAEAPERRHLESCPRCRIRMRSYREFVEDRSVPEGADPREAGKQLRAEFLRALEGDRRWPSPAAGGRLRDLRRLLLRPWVLAPAVAAIALAIGLYAGHQKQRTEADVLRGAAGPAEGRTPSILLLPSRIEPAGVELRWRSAAGAGSYEVVLLAEDLTDLIRRDTGRDTTLVLRWDDLDPRPEPGAMLGWQVVAVRDGAAMARSPIGALRVP